jgi:hypothetical protein
MLQRLQSSDLLTASSLDELNELTSKINEIIPVN